jgi:carboxypeptidase T
MVPRALLRHLALFLFLLPCTLLAEHHTSLVRAVVPDQATALALQKSGIDLLETRGKVGDWLEFPMAAELLDRLDRAGISYTIVQENMEETYAAAVRGLGPVNALGYGIGSMGGHYTYWEVAKQLDSMKVLYPNLITVKQVIGTTTKGRAIWAVKISDNPDVQESEPEVLYTGLIHAREPGGMMSVVYFMWHLLRNYGTDPQATFLVNNRQMWFVPVVNADGYEYNRKFYPTGGGMHRKNCRNVDTTIADSYYGTDLNRNFGTHEFWNSPYGGSSTTPTDDDYRGTLEWSEPESAALRNLAYAHAFRTALNFHTYGDYLIYPWGWKPSETPDSLAFREYSADMTRFNGYLAGRSTTTVGYTVRGSSDDFFYGDTAKPKAFSWTPEVGSQFWALPGDILPIALENLGPNLYLASIAGSYVLPASRTIADANANGYLERGEAFDLTAVLRNKGLSDAEGVTATLLSGSTWITVPDQPLVLGALASGATVPAAFQAGVAPNSPTGIPASLFLVISDLSGSTTVDTVRLMIGQPSISFVDSARTIANWTPQSPWGLSSTNHTPPSSFTDSPSGNYVSSIDKSLTLTNGLNLTGATSATLSFWTRWDLESGYDFARVEVSTNNGSNWRSLQGLYTHLGSGDGTQTATDWGLDGTQTTWLQEQMDLSAYANRTIKLRFRLTSDGSVQGDGWYVDDIRILAYSPNYDTALALSPASISLNGIIGMRADQPVTIHNYTGSTVTLTLAESLLTAFRLPGSAHTEGTIPQYAGLIRKLRQAPLPKPVPPAPVQSPLAFLPAATDLRGDNLPGGVDLLDVFYQKRTTILGPVLDLQVRLLSPDSALAGFLSLDTDQDFGTGLWPAPWGIGTRSRDIGSEYEMLIDLSGTIADSLGLGTLPVAVLFDVADTSIAYLPIIPSITTDSVMTVTVSGIPFGVLGLNDPDQNLNVGASFSRLSIASPFPDFAPNTGHGRVGTETGVSWIRENVQQMTIDSGDSAVVDVSVVGALPPGLHSARLAFTAPGQSPLFLPVTVTVTGLGNAAITVNATALADTLMPGDSSVFALVIGNTGSADLYWSLLDTAGVSWVTVAPLAGQVPPASFTTVDITLRSAGLTPGTVSATQLLLISNDGTHATIPFPVSLLVDDGTGVGPAGALPQAFRMYQNYPNPFNPATSIRIDVPREEEISLVVYDLLGREVSVLARGRLTAGVHTVRWEAGNLPSGVYICRFTGGGASESKRLLLLK